MWRGGGTLAAGASLASMTNLQIGVFITNSVSD